MESAEVSFTLSIKEKQEYRTLLGKSLMAIRGR